MVSVLVPISYVVFLFGSLAIFSKYYRRKQSAKEAPEPWFPRHKSRDIYVSLLSLEPPPPRPILVAALLRRAMEDVRLIWSVRDSKQALQTLLQKGQVGDELWEQFLQAEKELEAEIVEVVGEANTFQEGYGQQIFAIASEMVSHERWKEIYEKIPEKREAEKKILASGSPSASLALSPNTYLSPSSLTLAPANPLGADLTSNTPAPALTPEASTTTPAPSSVLVNGKAAAAPAPASAPASAPATPSKNGKARATDDGNDAENGNENDDENEDEQVAVAETEGTTFAPQHESATESQAVVNDGTATPPEPSPAGSGTTTPNNTNASAGAGAGAGSAKKKPNKKKKKPAVKGGR